MPTIYLDGSASLDTDLPDRLSHLIEAGYRLVLVASPGHASSSLSVWAERDDAVPESPPEESWYVTVDPATCRDRQPNLRTILIGPRDDGHWPTRCDLTARDMRDAVLKILAEQAMS